MKLPYALDRENEIAVRRGYKTRARSDEGGNVDQVPAVGVNREHAIALTVYGAVDDLTGKRTGGADRCDARDTFISCGKPPACRATTGYAGDADTVGIHVRKRLQKINGPNRVEELNAGRCITS